MVKLIEFMSLTTGKVYYFDPKTGISMWDNTASASSSVTNVPLPWRIMVSKSGKQYYYNTVTGVSQWRIPNNCKNIGGLNNVHNSCYIDSVLQALFVSPNLFTEGLLKGDISSDSRNKICRNDRTESIRARVAIQKELVNISDTIIGATSQKVKDVSKLRSLIRKCPVNQEFHGHGQHDSGEFLTYLLDFFPISSTATTRVVTWGTNSTDEVVSMTNRSKPSVVVDDKASVVITVDPFTLMSQDTEVDITHYLTEHNDSVLDSPFILDGASYTRRISNKSMVESPIVIININRRDPMNSGNVIQSKIIPTETIELVGGQKFTFSAVVLYQDHHYVCYYKCDDMWYLYNDLSNRKSSLIGTYETLIDSTDITTDGVTFYYNIL